MTSHAHSAHRRRALTQDRNFLIFWAGQTFAVLGDAVALIALPLLVLEATDSVARMGQVTAINGLGQLLSGLVAGPIVDRVDRRRLMIQCDIGRVICYGLIPIGWALFDEPLWLLYGLAFLAAMLGMIFGVSYVTAVANLVDRDQILDANGKLQTTFALSAVLGPMLAGLLFHRFGAGAVGLTAATYAISATTLSFVRLRRARGSEGRRVGGSAGYETEGREDGKTGSEDERRALPADPPTRRPADSRRRQAWLAGFRFLYEEPVFRSLTLLMGVFAFLATGGLDLIIFHVREDLHRSDQAVGIIFGVASAGAIAAGILATRLRRRWGFGPVFAVCFVIQGLMTMAIGFAGTVAFIVPVSMVYTFAETTRGTTTMTLRQELTPDHLLGRVTAAFWIAFSVPGPLGAAALTAIAERAGAGDTLVGIGLVAVIIGAVAPFTPAGSRRPRLHVTTDGTDAVPQEVIPPGLVDHPEPVESLR